LSADVVVLISIVASRAAADTLYSAEEGTVGAAGTVLSVLAGGASSGASLTALVVLAGVGSSGASDIALTVGHTLEQGGFTGVTLCGIGASCTGDFAGRAKSS
jgi:hypothetical protein